MPSFEENLQRNIFSGQSEKSFIDKILAKDDIANIRELVRKPRLTRSDMLELLYMMTGSEAKLTNLDEWSRYILLKFFVWIREFAKIAEQLYDYDEYLHSKKGFKVSERTKNYIDNNLRMLEHNIKFLVDLYFNISRTSLSIGATGFLELLNNKFEMFYGGNVPGGVQLQPEKKGIIRNKKGG